MEKEQQSSAFKCPLCSGMLNKKGRYYVCEENPLHRCLVSEVEDYELGDISLGMLRHRARIRMGKILHKR